MFASFLRFNGGKIRANVDRIARFGATIKKAGILSAFFPTWAIQLRFIRQVLNFI